MYPNLLGQKAFHKLNNDQMAEIISVSRTAYEQKMRSGRFTPAECKQYCCFFCKDFDYLFATEDRNPTTDKTA